MPFSVARSSTAPARLGPAGVIAGLWLLLGPASAQTSAPASLEPSPTTQVGAPQKSPDTLSSRPLSPKALSAALARPLNARQKERLHQQVTRLFGHQALLKHRAAVKVEGTTVAWACLAATPAVVKRADGRTLGEMMRLGDDGLQVLAMDLPNFTQMSYQVQAEGQVQQGGEVRVEHFPEPREAIPNPSIPSGRLEAFEWTQSRVFPESHRRVTVYIPANYHPALRCGLMVWQDGSRHADLRAGGLRAPVVMDHLIHTGDMPPVIGIFVDPGRRPQQRAGDKAAFRSLEYDSLGDAYSRLLIEEVLPEVRRRYQVDWLPHPDAHAIGGGSSGGICAFTVAWERPADFRKVLCWVGSFVDLRGGHAYPSLIRTSEPKPLRVYLLAGENDLDNGFGHWPTASKLMSSALAYQGYDHHLEWTPCFHGSRGMAARLPDALRWLWRDWRETFANDAAE